MLKVFLLIATLAAPMAAMAEIRICPITGRPYDTTHGRNVDEPGTRQYVPPSQRNIRSSYSSGSRSSSSTDWTYEGYSDTLGY
jgi:hypothetical protein